MKTKNNHQKKTFVKKKDFIKKSLLKKKFMGKTKQNFVQKICKEKFSEKKIIKKFSRKKPEKCGLRKVMCKHSETAVLKIEQLCTKNVPIQQRELQYLLKNIKS